MAIEANRYIGRVEGTSKSLIILRPGSEIHVLSVPFFNQTCEAEDDNIAKTTGQENALVLPFLTSRPLVVETD